MLITTQYNGENAFVRGFAEFQNHAMSDSSQLQWDGDALDGAEVLVRSITHDNKPPLPSMLGPGKLRDATVQDILLVNTLTGRLTQQQAVTSSAFDSCLAEAMAAATRVANKAVQALTERFPPRATTDCLRILHPDWYLNFTRQKSGTALDAASATMRNEFDMHAETLELQFAMPVSLA
jgi:hypothetical protein